MIQHLLVPLDGSRLAESAIPAAASLAVLLNAEVTLIHIIERSPPGRVHGELHLTTPEDAETYLDRISRENFSKVRRVVRHIHGEDVKTVSRTIALHEEESGHDLVVMCTHGGRAGRMLFGSIAKQVIAGGTVPVLLLRPPTRPFKLGVILAPVDGDVDHEAGLAIAKELARAGGASVHVLAVVPTLGTFSGKGSEAGMLLPGATRALLEMSVEGIQGYLEERTSLLKGSGLNVTADVARGDPATRIADAASSLKVDLIVLATHGKMGMDAIFSGSVANKVLARCDMPLLLAPVGKTLRPSSRS